MYIYIYAQREMPFLSLSPSLSVIHECFSHLSFRVKRNKDDLQDTLFQFRRQYQPSSMREILISLLLSFDELACPFYSNHSVNIEAMRISGKISQ
jgi:hypothetical protein